MNVITKNLTVDLLTFVVTMGVAVTGLLLRFVLPPGSGGLELWGLERHDWGDVHFWLVVGLGVLVVVHVALHWAWVCVAISRVFGRRAALSRRRNWFGIAFLAVLVAGSWGLIVLARSQVEAGPDGGRHRGHGRQAGLVLMPVEQSQAPMSQRPRSHCYSLDGHSS